MGVGGHAMHGVRRWERAGGVGQWERNVRERGWGEGEECEECEECGGRMRCVSCVT